MRFQLKKTLLALALCLAVPFFASAQNVTVKGVVTDASGEPIIGASVMVVNTTNGAVTDINGSYTITVPANATVEVACMGYTTQVIPVQGRNRIDVVLLDDAEQLEATVVIGYGTARRQDVTGSIASVGGENLRAVPLDD